MNKVQADIGRSNLGVHSNKDGDPITFDDIRQIYMMIYWIKIGDEEVFEEKIKLIPESI
ncbi:hypothetical protein [Ammoniphilus oxalaticus]|uniref:hypothetical protein n=1 Tax=Ammoniphilus oxalaticus TaxID=66863 RepID=UPI001474D415|nr:hypothetical protein [Ammoniphilus oxalaticus]